MAEKDLNNSETSKNQTQKMKLKEQLDFVLTKSDGTKENRTG